MEYPTPTQGTRVVVSPSKVVLGTGAVEELGEYVDQYGDKPLVLASEEIYNIQGDKVENALNKNDIESVLYTGVRPDPTVENIEEAYHLWKTEGCDVIVTLGGGSSIDTGKGVGILANNEGNIRDFGTDKAGEESVPNPIPPLIAVNTTAGTGSEATRSVVVTDESTSTKFLILSQNVVPEVAIEDPELTVSLPRSHTSFTGIDALTHAIEAFVSIKSYSVPDDFARNAIRRISNSFTKAWANGENIDARTEMMIGQLQAGQAFTNSSVALVHGMARPLGAQLHIPHGLANALLLPYVMEFSVIGAPEKYAEIGRMMGNADKDTPDREAAERASDAVLALCEDADLTGYLDDHGDVPPRDEYVEIVDKMAKDAIDSGSPANNPRKPTEEEIRELYIELYDDALAPDSPRRS